MARGRTRPSVGATYAQHLLKLVPGRERGDQGGVQCRYNQRRELRALGISFWWRKARVHPNGRSGMTSETHQLVGLGFPAGREAVECFLPEAEIRKLDRDLRILIASNGTLTRILGIVADDEVVVQIVEQHVHGAAPQISGLEQLPGGRILQRRILLNGRSSGRSFVAAESLVAVDLLPPAITTTLLETEHPIGEIMAASALESFKEAADVWVGRPPDWLALAGYQTSEPTIVARRYRVISDGQPAIIITEYFLRDDFQKPSVT
jgi:chorismate lyase